MFFGNFVLFEQKLCNLLITVVKSML